MVVWFALKPPFCQIFCTPSTACSIAGAVGTVGCGFGVGRCSVGLGPYGLVNSTVTGTGSH